MIGSSSPLASEDSLKQVNNQTAQRSVDISGSDPQTFIVKQGDTEYEVEALHHEDYGNRTVEEFYGYNDNDPASANTPNDMERENVSQLFFYKGPEKTSLVVIHDEPYGSASGGEVVFEFENLPSEGEWSVPDDSGDDYSRDRVHWNWVRCCTDGGVYGGGFETAFYMEISPEFEEGIDTNYWDEEWVLVDGSNSTIDREPLDTESTVKIGSIGELSNRDDANFVVDLPFNPCITTGLDGEEFCLRGGSIVKLGPRECSNTSSGETPYLASVDINYFETDEHGNTRYNRSFWVGVELEGQNPCMWVGEEDAGACTRVPTTCGELQNVVADDQLNRQTAREIANALYEAFQEIREDFEDGLFRERVFIIGVILVVILLAIIISSSPFLAVVGVGGAIGAGAS